MISTFALENESLARFYAAAVSQLQGPEYIKSQSSGTLKAVLFSRLVNLKVLTILP